VPVPAKRATVQATMFFRTRHPHDGDNTNAMLKPNLDGLQDAGIVANDSQITLLPPIFAYSKDDPRMILEIKGFNS